MVANIGHQNKVAVTPKGRDRLNFAEELVFGNFDRLFDFLQIVGVFDVATRTRDSYRGELCTGIESRVPPLNPPPDGVPIPGIFRT